MDKNAFTLIICLSILLLLMLITNVPAPLAYTGRPLQYGEYEGFSDYSARDYSINLITSNNALARNSFMDAEGNPSCLDKSSGLSNSGGPLCMSEDQLRELRTRGGNFQ